MPAAAAAAVAAVGIVVAAAVVAVAAVGQVAVAVAVVSLATGAVGVGKRRGVAPLDGAGRRVGKRRTAAEDRASGAL